MRITGKTRLAGILGWPVSHSASPCLHGFWLDAYGIDGAFVPLPVHPDNFETALRALPRLGFCGANVTIPHKEAAWRLCDTLSDAARVARSVNTLVFSTDGSIHGDTTDGFGFMENLRQQVGGGCTGSALVLGAGGAARSVVSALLDTGVSPVLVSNRTIERTRTLAEDLGPDVVIVDWDRREQALASVSLLVNTTSLGMTGHPPLPLSLDTLPGQVVVCDIVYTPLETALLAAARQRGNPVVEGLGMLLHQARPGFRAWFGVMPSVDNALREHVARGMNLA